MPSSSKSHPFSRARPDRVVRLPPGDLTDERGRRVATIRETPGGLPLRVYRDGTGFACAARVVVPPAVTRKAQGWITAAVELPEQGLRWFSSSKLRVAPPVRIRNCRWSKEAAREGEVVTLTAQVGKVPDGTPCRLRIFRYGGREAREKVADFKASAEADGVEVLWSFSLNAKRERLVTQAELEAAGSTRGYDWPAYFFTVECLGVVGSSLRDAQTEQARHLGQTGLLTFQDWIELRMEGGGGERYALHLADGSVRRGTLGEEGRALEEDVPPGPAHDHYPDLDL